MLYLLRYIFFIEKMVRLLKKFAIQPIFVFDGAKFPAKRHTDEQRSRHVIYIFSIHLVLVKPNLKKVKNLRIREILKKHLVFLHRRFPLQNL